MARESDPVIMHFAQAVARLRRERGWSMEELSRRSGLTISEISRIERAQREPRLSTIVGLANGLGVDPGLLLPDDLRRRPTDPS